MKNIISLSMQEALDYVDRLNIRNLLRKQLMKYLELNKKGVPIRFHYISRSTRDSFQFYINRYKLGDISLDDVVEITSKELKHKVQELSRKYSTEEKKFERKRLNVSLFNKVLMKLKEEKGIDSKDIMYFPENYSFTSEEFNDFFITMIDYLEEEKGYLVDSECMFANKRFFIKHEEQLIEFFIMWGQGTAFIVKLVEDTNC